MNITTSYEAGNLTLHAPKSFSFDHIDSLNQVQENYNQQALSSVTVDFKQTDFLDSIGIGILLRMRGSFGHDTPISLINCKPSLLKLFKVCNLYPVFNIKN